MRTSSSQNFPARVEEHTKTAPKWEEFVKTASTADAVDSIAPNCPLVE